MTDITSDTALLIEEKKKQLDRIKADTLEETERLSTRQITLKSGDAFLVADVCGDLLSSKQEMGLFWHGTRFLHTCNLFLEGRPLVMLSHHVADVGSVCQIDLTNTALSIDDNTKVKQGEIHVHRVLELQDDALIQTITVTSFHTLPVPVMLALKLGADFRDLFEVRGLMRQERGQFQPTRMDATSLIFDYRGIDTVERETRIMFAPPVDSVLPDRVFWDLQLKRNQPVELRMIVKVNDSDQAIRPSTVGVAPLPTPTLPTVITDNLFFNRLLARGMSDLMMLSTMTPHGRYPYAGIPWFSCPFGRDGLITCLEFLPWFPDVVRGTLAFLAAYQGAKVEPFTDEEPGKMLHEFRTGEMANCREIPFIPYYGSIDVTPLFLITLEAYIRWTHDLPFLLQLWPAALAAARWIEHYGDRDGDSFIEYVRASKEGLANQGWKDAWDSVSQGNGQLATSPIALCEVQGYAFAAYRAVGYLVGQLGNEHEAARWEQKAEILRENFLRRFWWEDESIFYLALNGAKEPCDVVSSNAGQCLWTGIVPQELASRVAERLMRHDMYSGWGIRTLSERAVRYNPMSYHNGSVWPHDTAIAGAGFAHYGKKAEAAVLLKSIYEASLSFEGARLPELYCGFPRRYEAGPTRYPLACSPQAWAAGAPFLLLSALLGLQPDAEHGRLFVEQPRLPDWLQIVDMPGIYVGGKSMHLRFVRAGSVTEVVTVEGNGVEVCVV